MFDRSLLDILITIPGIILGFSVHEYAHARMAFLLGDSTAADDGRMTMDCTRHIDPMGFLFLIIAGFGWAKPVLINPEAFKNPKRDEILVSLAGPLSNLVLAFIFFTVYKLMTFTAVYPYTGMMHTTMSIILMGAYINLGLFVFNMIPLPPLDGSHLYMVFLRTWNQDLAAKLSQYGFMVLIGMMVFENQSGIDILPIMSLVNWFGDGMRLLLRL
jgi:Zn-dependent protease